MSETNNKMFYCCGKSFIGAYDRGLKPHCPVCGKYPEGYKRGILRVRKKSNYVRMSLRVKIKNV